MPKLRRRRKLSPGRLIAVGFLSVIALGTLLLSLPLAHSGAVPVTLLDALFTPTSCVCVTGLATVEAGAAFSPFGQAVMLLLIQIGGLGITSLGAGLVALLGGRLNQRENNLVREALNYPTMKGILPLIRSVILLDFTIELIGALLSFLLFLRDFPVKRALWLGVFHSVSAFNNAGFDILGNGNSIGVYRNDLGLQLLTAALILLGGLGFFVIREILFHKKGERFSLHTRVVLMMTGVLLLGGTVLFKITEGANLSWLDAFFASVTARTAGFATVPFGGFSNAGILGMVFLMFIGASPGSTGGGMKTTTVFALANSLVSVITGREARAFGKKLRDETMYRAFLIVSLGLCWAFLLTGLLSFFEPHLGLRDLLFETVSALATVGLTTGITPTLTLASKLGLIVTMYVGRLGPLTIATLWSAPRRPAVSRPVEDFPVG